MKTRTEIRLECLRMANTQAGGGKMQPTDEVIARATTYLDWVTEANEAEAEGIRTRRYGT